MPFIIISVEENAIIMKSAILFLIFKRVDTTKRVFERIREAQPKKLYIAADGPREGIPDEKKKCEETRKLVEVIDWPCEVHRLYREENLGCGKGVSSAITWFFEHEEQGIIIEDDILAHIDFFTYCDEMLDRYKDDNRIQLIAGRNAFYKGYESPYSYYMSSLFHIWGWASWRRVWNTYEFDSSKLSAEKFADNIIRRTLPPKTIIYWKELFNVMQTKPIDTWDYQLYFNEIINGRYSIIPYVNMTENLGFGSIEATHTKGIKATEVNHIAQSPYPLKHPDDFYENANSDAVFAKNFGFLKGSIYDKYVNKAKRAIYRVIHF